MYERLSLELSDCSLFVVIGTSGEVIGVNHIAQFAEHSILNNLESSYAIQDSLFSKVLYTEATKAIDEIAEDIHGYLL